MGTHFTSVKFSNYKTFRKFSVSLANFNIVVGANNAGKSTILGAFRILAEGMRRAHSKKAEYNDSPLIRGWGYPVALADLPISTENVFTDYDDSEPAVVEFAISNGNSLKLIFPEQDYCFLKPETDGRQIRMPGDFKRAFDCPVYFAPILGPVEHDEDLNVRETARRALLTHRASRNFRNIWHHFPENFANFRSLIQDTWSGMDIQMPELSRDSSSAKLHMFCHEDRVARELYWAGFGFQVWCQMLTFIAKAPAGSLLIIDEPDIYLHSDLQRQLVNILRERNGDTLIATHSTEMISEAEAGEIVVLSRKSTSARRIKNPSQLQGLFGALGSNLNPTLTQLSKTKRALFVEGEDFGLLSAFARKLGFRSLANRSSFAVVGANGFNPARVSDFSDGMETTLGLKIARGVVFDRDYRPESIVASMKLDFGKKSDFVWIHERKELENFLLVPEAIVRAIRTRLQDKQARGGTTNVFDVDLVAQLDEMTQAIKSDVFGQYNALGVKALCTASPGLDVSTASATVHREFEARWNLLEERLKLVPGKELISRINDWLQRNFGVSITTNAIVSAMHVSEIPEEMKQLIQGLVDFTNKRIA